MKKQIEIQDGKNLLIVNIKVKDYFSITADYLEPLKNYLEDIDMTRKKAEKQGYLVDLTTHKGKEYILTMAGCLHDEILKHRPDLKFMIDMHLSDVKTGKPMHAYENGKYWYNQDKNKGLNYLRANTKDSIGNDFDMLYAQMVPKWKIEAEETIKLINNIV